MMRKNRPGRKWNNKGSALVTVVVVTSFISILVTIILYLAGMNYFMKTTDKKNKDSFYEAETAMESIKANLMIEAKGAFQEAYKDTLITFAKSTPDDRTLTYNQAFVNALEKSFDQHIADNAVTGDGTLGSYMKGLVPAGYTTAPNNLTVAAAGLDLHANEGYVLIPDVRLHYEKDGYVTEIKTDFMIKAPKIDWGIETSATSAPGSPDDLVRQEHEMADCVIYYNWEKNAE